MSYSNEKWKRLHSNLIGAQRSNLKQFTPFLISIPSNTEFTLMPTIMNPVLLFYHLITMIKRPDQPNN